MSRQVEFTHRERGTFGKGFGLSLGCLCGIGFFLAACVVGVFLLCGGCVTAMKQSQDYLQEERERQEKIKEERNRRPALEVAPVPRSIQK